MQCRQCGTEIADKALICYRCGTATTEAVYKPVKASGGSSKRSTLILVLIAVLVLLALLYFLFPTALGRNGEAGRLPVATAAGDRLPLIDDIRDL